MKTEPKTEKEPEVVFVRAKRMRRMLKVLTPHTPTFATPSGFDLALGAVLETLRYPVKP